MARPPRTTPAAATTSLAVKVVGRTAGVLALLGVATFVVIVVLLIAGGAGGGHDVSATPLGSFTLNVLVPILAGSLILSLLLALLNSIGVRPWFDPATGRFSRPRSSGAWAVALGGLLAGILIPVTLITVVVAAIVVTSLDPGSDAIEGVLTGIAIGGIGAAVTGAAIAGGVALMGWFGVVAGLMLGAGFVGVVIAATSGSPVAWVLGLVGLGLAVASYFAGARMHGTIPSSAGWVAASGGYLGLGLGFFLYAAIERDPMALVGGLAGVAATAGWVIGGRTLRRRPNGRAA